jgi:L-threonylcarbamoyladenylate synthase
MKIIKINFQKPEKKIIEETVKVIKKGGAVIVPTDTVYGLTVNVLNEKAVRRLFLIKKRPFNKPFSVFVKDFKMAEKLACIGGKKEKILRKFWPGQITFILKKKEIFPNFLTANKKTIGLRIPDCLIIKNLFNFLNFPLIGTSANISGKPASGEIKKIIKQFQSKKNKPDLILDAGNLPESKPSTIVDLTLSAPKVLRKGKISF